jgi:phosphate transport system substrate-binding protein
LHRKRLVGLSVAALVVAMSAVTAVANGAVLVTGAGSTLVQPLIQQWSAHSSLWKAVTYGGVGSGTGIEDITARSVDFGASDAPMTSAQVSACKGCVQIPWALTATAVAYNVKGVSGLKLTGPVLAQIYQGKITSWNAPAIKKLNKGKRLPNLKITPVFRSDGSGDTYAFTDFLSHTSSSWSHSIGTSTAVSFPAGTGAKGNAGVTFVVGETQGSIGYIAASYLIAHRLPAAAVQNAAGNFEFPNLKNIKNAASSVKHVGSNGLHIVDPPKKFKIAYPISTFTNGIFPKSSSKASALQALVRYAVGTGQKFGAALDFQTIPAVVKAADLKLAKQIHG